MKIAVASLAAASFYSGPPNGTIRVRVLPSPTHYVRMDGGKSIEVSALPTCDYSVYGTAIRVARDIRSDILRYVPVVTLLLGKCC